MSNTKITIKLEKQSPKSVAEIMDFIKTRDNYSITFDTGEREDTHSKYNGAVSGAVAFKELPEEIRLTKEGITSPAQREFITRIL